jgi:phytol kinase
MTFVLVSVLFMGVCVGVEVLARRVQLPPELVRKLAHMSAAVLAAFLPLVLPFVQIAALGLLFALVMAVSVRLRVFSAIHGVSRTTYGEVFFPLGIAALAILCPSALPFAYGVLVLGLGDGLAALVGERLGRRVVPLLRTRKTLWGSGTFLVVCFAVGVLLMVPAGVPLPYAVAAAAALAIVLTPVELYLTHGLDNLVLPALAGSLAAAL